MILSPISGGSGGIQSWTLRLKKCCLQDETFSDTVLFCDKGQFFCTLGNRTTQRVVFGILNHLIIFSRYLSALYKFRPNILHLNISGGLSAISDVLYSLLAIFFGIKLVIHVRFGRVPLLYQKRGFEYSLLSILFRNSHAIIAIDENTFNCLRSKYSRVYYLANPVNFYAKDLKLDRILRVILFAGHVRKTKGIEDLLTVSSKLGKSRILVCGRIDKNYRKYLTEKYPIIRDRVFFLGEVSNHDLITLMNICSCLCLPSYSEGFPNVILEAFACKIPVVAYNVGQIPALIGQDERGHLVELGDLVGLYQSLNLVLDSPDMNLKLEAAFKFKADYEENLIFKQLFKIWKEI